MKIIELTRGYKTLVDDDDFDLLNQWKWTAFVYKSDGRVRAVRNKRYGSRKENKSMAILMHRFIISAPDGLEVDHKNLNTLDNRKENLRLATKSQNNMNRPIRANNKTGYKGVQARGNVFRARIRKDKKDYSLGQFQTAIEAAKAYNKKAIKLFGEFARLNEI